MRVLHGPLVGLRDADDVEQLDGPRRAPACVEILVRPDHLDDLLADPLHRVQRRQRVLEDHRDPLAADRPSSSCRRTDELGPATVADRVILADFGSRPIRPRNVTDLPEPDSPTTPTISPVADVEVDAANGLDVAVHRSGSETRKSRSASTGVSTGISRPRPAASGRCVAQAVADEVDADRDREQQRHAGNTASHQLPATSARSASAQQVAERRLTSTGCGPKPKKLQRRLADDGGDDRSGERDEDRTDEFGRRWRKMIRPLVAPSGARASMNSRSFSDST